MVCCCFVILVVAKNSNSALRVLCRGRPRLRILGHAGVNAML